jgi:hypothetical protein
MRIRQHWATGAKTSPTPEHRDNQGAFIDEARHRKVIPFPEDNFCN